MEVTGEHTIVVSYLFKTCVLLAACLSLYLGYKLIIQGAKGSFKFQAKLKGVKADFYSTAPGIMFVLCGICFAYFALRGGHSIETTIPYQAKDLSVQVISKTNESSQFKKSNDTNNATIKGGNEDGTKKQSIGGEEPEENISENVAKVHERVKVKGTFAKSSGKPTEALDEAVFSEIEEHDETPNTTNAKDINIPDSMTIEKIDGGIILRSKDYDYIIHGQDLSEMVGKKIKVTGTITEGDSARALTDMTVELVDEK